MKAWLMQSILIKIDVPAECNDKRKEKTAKLKIPFTISQLTKVKDVHKYCYLKNNLENSKFPQIARTCITVLYKKPLKSLAAVPMLQ